MTPEEMKNRIFWYVLIEVNVVERKAEMEGLLKRELPDSSLPSLAQADLVLYHLEDLVSPWPCWGLLEDQNDTNIIKNVKNVINNLHYS